MHRLLIAAVVAIGALSGAAAVQHAHIDPGVEAIAHWHEIAWPFPRDGWPMGRAFRCDAAACGDAVELYLRPKIGFCNCDSGVADDDEVDRVADLDLISPRFAPLREGKVVHLAGMSGRARAYDITLTDGAKHAAIGFALSRRCDLLVAVAQGRGSADEIQRVAVNFLDADIMTRWMAAALNGG